MLSGFSLTLLFLAACDYTVPLDRGYRLIRTGGGGRFVLATPEGPDSHVIVGPSVSAYRDSPEFVVGKVTGPGEATEEAYRPGYFVVDKRSGQLLWGLTRDEWLQALQERGLSTPPQLKKPNRFRTWY